MKAGFFEHDISPSIGLDQAGNYGKHPIQGFHDPLKARAAVFDDGHERVALVGVDLCTIPSADMVRAVRAEIERQCGIKPQAVMIAASHTHNAGPTFGAMPEAFTHAPALIRRLSREFSPSPEPVYVTAISRLIASAVIEADRRRQDAVLGIGIGNEAHVAFNRRLRMKQGRVYTHPGKGNPDIIEPAGPTDPQVIVIGAWTPEGRPLGCVVNFACHGTTLGGRHVSADWIYYMERVIKGFLGQEAGIVFLNGACGDLTQIDNRSLRQWESGERWASFVGTRVGAEAIKVLATMDRGILAPIHASATTLSVARRRPARVRVTQARAIVQAGLQNPKQQDPIAWTFAKELLLADTIARNQPKAHLEIQAIQLGGALFVSNPAELFCQLGLDIKKNSPFPITAVVELANGICGYVPTLDAFQPDGGGYETTLTSYTNLEITAGNKIVQASLQLARRLKPGTLPKTPCVPTLGKPWGYGILGPDLA